jgi:hypothetical protein
MECVQIELDAFTEERQWVITQARQGQITEEDMECQLSALSIQELGLRCTLADLKKPWSSRILMVRNFRRGIISATLAPGLLGSTSNLRQMRKSASNSRPSVG